jgi:DNA-binding CsgD family transcriptional regulator
MKRGKKPLELDAESIMKLARIGCTTEEIALVLGCSKDTIERHYMDALQKGRAQRRMSLRHRQYQKALKGDTGMMIWLGKQDLGQKERSELTGSNDGPVQIQIVERFTTKATTTDPKS